MNQTDEPAMRIEPEDIDTLRDALHGSTGPLYAS
jgi:hypothetical protein